MTSMPNRIKLMSDYECWCLWDMDATKYNRSYNIDPEKLPLSKALKLSLSDWENDFDQTLDKADHANIGFSDEQKFNAFYERGWELIERLRSELPGTEFWYMDRRFSEPLQQRPNSTLPKLR